MIYRKPKGWQLDSDLCFGRHCQLVPADGATGYQYQERKPILFSGQAEAIWFDTGRVVKYGRKHLFRRRIIR